MKTKWHTLYQQAEAKAAAVSEVSDPEEAQRLLDEAEALMAQAERVKSAEAIQARVGEAQLPAALPGSGDAGNMPQPEMKTAEQSNKEATVKAFYQMRFGETDAAVKAILVDLHGSDYEQKRADQWTGFAHYLRTGQVKGLNEFLWTPESIRLALKEGQDVRAMKAVMVEAQDTLGGYLVPVDFQNEIISRLMGLTVVRPRARVTTTSRDSVEYVAITGGDSQYRGAVRVTWVDETPAAGTAETNLTFGVEKISVHTVMAEAFLSRNVVEDAASNIVGELTTELSEAMAIDEDNRFLTGSGTGNPEGILKDGGIDVLGAGQQVVSGDASTLTWDGLIDLAWALDWQYRQNAAFLGAKATYQTIAKMKDANNQYLWRREPGNNATEGGPLAPRTLEGFPILEQESMPAVAADAYPLILGDFRGYRIVDRVGMSVERYLDSATARVNQVCFIARRRLGGQVVEPWRFAAMKVAAS